MERKRFTVIRGGRDAAPPAAPTAVDLDCVPRDRWRRTVELRRDGEVVGVLRRLGATGFRAEAEAGGKVWLLDRAGLTAFGITVRCDGGEFGSYDNGHLSLRDHRIRHTHGRWIDGSGRVLVRSRGDRLRVESAGVGFPEHLLLALLGEYLKQVDPEPPEGG